MLDVVEPIGALDVAAVHGLGVGLAVAGIAATFYAQVAMGASWRIGVDPSERTALVTGGPFALVLRVVEEPYLLQVHGETYAIYAARVGRFVPGVGRLRTR